MRVHITPMRDPLLQITSTRKVAAICRTPGERSILRLRQAGLDVREISDAERVSRSHVCQTLQRIRQRLSVKSEADAGLAVIGGFVDKNRSETAVKKPQSQHAEGEANVQIRRVGRLRKEAAKDFGGR